MRTSTSRPPTLTCLNTLVPEGQEPTAIVANALTRMLLRRFRISIYEQVQTGVTAAVQDGTVPILAALRRGSADSTTLAEQLGLDRTTVSRQVDALVAAGFVTRSSSMTDRRSTMLTLTVDGRQDAERLHKNISATVASALEDWTASDRAAIARLLPRLVDALQAGRT